MNAEQLLTKVAEAVKARRPSVSKRFWICYNNGKFTCVPVAPPAENGIVLGTYTTDELQKGLTTRQWSKLLGLIAKIQPEETT